MKMMGRQYYRLDRQDSGRMHDSSKRQKALERTGASFRGLWPSAMKKEKRWWWQSYNWLVVVYSLHEHCSCLVSSRMTASSSGSCNSVSVQSALLMGQVSTVWSMDCCCRHSQTRQLSCADLPDVDLELFRKQFSRNHVW